jgi:para-nitrobenzyl esterase
MAADMEHVTTTTRAGAVRGDNTGAAFVFRGVPYAAPPVGPLRFRPAAPVERWEGVRDCTVFGPICPQVTLGGDGGGEGGEGGGMMRESATSAFIGEQNEDCLSLNVWTPALDDGARPVMVWFHGGGAMGSGSAAAFDGSAFAEDDIVLVTVNYRLGAFGFLYLDEGFDGAFGTGNQGILDQVAALRWVRDEIGAFGGDPANVTIFGESYGGMSVASLLTTSVARGLFRRAVLQSAPAQRVFPLSVAREVTQHALAMLGVAPGDWDALAAVPTDALAQLGAEGQQLAPDDSVGPLAFWPVVDGVTRTDRPCQMIADGAAEGVDLLVGWTADETKLFEVMMPAGSRSPRDVDRLVAATAQSAHDVLEIYRRSGRGETESDLLSAISTDEQFIVPSMRIAAGAAAHHDRVYAWQLSWPSPALDGRLGACHSLDVPLVFRNPSPLVGEDPPAALREMHDAWVRFARTGEPGGGTLPAWPAYDTARRAVMDFNVACTVVDDPNPAARRLWEDVRDSAAVT